MTTTTTSALRRHRWIGLALAGAIGVATLAGCSSSDSSSATSSTSTTSAAPTSTATGSSTLDPDVAAGVVYMREEEKLARDVYEALADQWGASIFSNIAASEQTHMDSVATLLTAYGLTDPAASTGRGEFTEPAIQQLYDELIALGSQSLIDALTVGAMIEDLDIVDLQDRATDVPDIAAVYDNLTKGSRDHLRSFVSQLEAQGATYTPTHLTQAEYDAIISSATERGNGN